MTKIISAFPGTGKTYFYQNSNLNVMDSDSSKFSWVEKGKRHPEFPSNYINHIKQYIGKTDYVLVSSHKDVRDALVNEGIDYSLIFPDISLKNEYLERFKQRGSSEQFINLISKNWNEWITELENQTNCSKIKLNENQYLSDIL